MKTATFQFHADLDELLPKGKRGAKIQVKINGHETVKHLIEALGVPHTEVDVVLVNGESVPFAYRLKSGDQVQVYPPRVKVDVTPVIRLRPEGKGEARFVLDGHLGRLAAYLRLFGFDALYRNDFDDDELASISCAEDRLLLTRDRGLLKRAVVHRGYWVREKEPQRQLEEIFNRFSLASQARPFTRCAKCNGLLKPVSKEEVYERLEPKTKAYYHDFRKCEQCDQVYWKGSHFRKLEKLIQKLLK